MMEHYEAVEELARETRSSIEVTRNAKGDYQWTIKHYHEAGDEAVAFDTIKYVEILLRHFYLDGGAERIEQAVDEIISPPNLESQLEASVAQAQARKAERAP